MSITKLKRDKKHLYTVEEYLAIDRSSEERYEYYDGEIRLMAGESDAHGIISGNLMNEVAGQLKDKKYQVSSKVVKVRSSRKFEINSIKGTFTFPDIVVFEQTEQTGIISKPKVIIEILPPEKKITKRKHKFTRYHFFNPTLTDYVSVSQDFPFVDHFIRQNDGSWKVNTYIGLDQVFTIESIECTLNLMEIYDRIEFPKEVFDELKEIRNV
jgi:Uma2 family endonuclease